MRRSGRRKLFVVGNVFPEIPEIFRRKGLAIRPSVAFPKVQRKYPAVFDFHVLENIRHQVEILVVTDQSGVTVDGEQSNVLAAVNEAAQVAAIAPRKVAGAVGNHQGLARQAFLDTRQGARGNTIDKKRRLDELSRQFRRRQPGGQAFCRHERRRMNKRCQAG